MSIGLHPKLIGQASGIYTLREFIAQRIDIANSAGDPGENATELLASFKQNQPQGDQPCKLLAF